MACQLFAHYVYFQLENEWNYVRKLFTNFLLASLSPASLEKCLKQQLSSSERKNYVGPKATLSDHCSTQLHLQWGKQVSVWFPKHIAILVRVLINVTSLLCTKFLKCEQQASCGSLLWIVSSLVYLHIMDKIILALAGNCKHVPVKDNLYVLCRQSFHFVPCLPILEEDLSYPQEIPYFTPFSITESTFPFMHPSSCTSQ